MVPVVHHHRFRKAACGVMPHHSISIGSSCLWSTHNLLVTDSPEILVPWMAIGGNSPAEEDVSVCWLHYFITHSSNHEGVVPRTDPSLTSSHSRPSPTVISVLGFWVLWSRWHNNRGVFAASSLSLEPGRSCISTPMAGC